MADDVHWRLYRLADRVPARRQEALDAANAIDGAFTKGTEAIVRAYARGRRILERANG